jgi:hypothetical protein
VNAKSCLIHRIVSPLCVSAEYLEICIEQIEFDVAGITVKQSSVIIRNSKVRALHTTVHNRTNQGVIVSRLASFPLGTAPFTCPLLCCARIDCEWEEQVDFE